jgi:hypothetical protein
VRVWAFYKTTTSATNTKEFRDSEYTPYAKYRHHPYPKSSSLDSGCQHPKAIIDSPGESDKHPYAQKF